MDKSRFTVLVVDDDVPLRRLVLRALQTSGIETIGAGTAAEGLEVFLAHPGKIDLVIVDMVMPGMSGLDLAAELERLQPGVQILYISGSGDSIAMKSIQRQSADRVMLKPFVPEALVERVTQLLAVGGIQPVRLARLVFCTFAGPLREGVRGPEAAACHMLFEEGNWLVDLHLKPQPDRNQMYIAGQVLERSPSEPLAPGHTIAVVRENVDLARATTNDLGEFQLEFIPGEDVVLMVNLPGESVLVANLQEFAAAKGSFERTRTASPDTSETS